MRRVLLPFLAMLLIDSTLAYAAPADVPPAAFGQRMQSLLGLLVFTMAAFIIGRVRGARKIPWRVVIWGTALQVFFALVVLYTPGLLVRVQNGVQALLDYTRAGATMVFGDLATGAGAVVRTGEGGVVGYASNVGYFAFFVLPTIIFFSALTAVAYHSGVMQYVVQGLAWIMAKTTGTSGAETLSTAANIFVGQTEAPLMIRPFVPGATRSELMVIMVGGFANIASGVLGLYTDWLSHHVANVGGHLAAACFISAPATLVVGKLLLPETAVPATAGGVEFRVERTDANLVDAAARGTTEGLTLALNVAAMLIAFTALVALVNGVIGQISMMTGLTTAGDDPITLQRIFGWIMSPLAWLTGIPWSESQRVGGLLGIKTVLNELIAFSDMKDRFSADANFLSPRSAVIATYALCGFANFASIGIQVGGISTLAPERRHDLSRIALVAMMGGTLASLMAASVVGILL